MADDPVSPMDAQDDNTLSPPSASLEEIRKWITDLVTSDSIDKLTALEVTRCFHAMETLMRYECTMRERKVSELRGQADRLRLQSELDRFARRHTLDEVRREESMPTPAAVPVQRGRSVRRSW